MELSNGKVDDINNVWFIGKRLNVYYDYEQIGIWQSTPEDLAELAKFNANIPSANSQFRPGSIRVRDLNNDYKIDANNDRKIVGQAQPSWNAGLINGFNYRNWSLNIFMFGRFGYNVVRVQNRYKADLLQRRLNYWTPTNATNEYPAPNYNSAAGDPFRSAMNNQDGSFIRTVPPSWWAGRWRSGRSSLSTGATHRALQSAASRSPCSHQLVSDQSLSPTSVHVFTLHSTCRPEQWWRVDGDEQRLGRLDPAGVPRIGHDAVGVLHGGLAGELPGDTERVVAHAQRRSKVVDPQVVGAGRVGHDAPVLQRSRR